LGNAHKGMVTDGLPGLSVTVRNNDVDRGISKFRRALAADRWVTDIRANEFFVSKGEKARKAKMQASRRQEKQLQEEDESLNHDTIHHLSAIKRGRTRKARRIRDRKVQQAYDEAKRNGEETKKEIPFFGDYNQFTK
jgi:ribosomal protein S21